MPESQPLDPAQLREHLCIPVGTVEFRYSHPLLFERDTAFLLIEVPAGQHYFRLERAPGSLLLFYHSSPGTGTRVATLDLQAISISEHVEVGFSWSPEGIGLALWPNAPDAPQIVAHGHPSDTQYRVGSDGRIFQSGNLGVRVESVRFTQGGVTIVEPSAIEAWVETVRAIEILATGQSTEGFMHEVVQTNLTIAMLVTGYEAYAKKRFKELPGEGVKPNLSALIGAFSTKKERESGVDFSEDAEALGLSVLEFLANKKINFQNIDDCKAAYNKAFQLKFGEVEGVSSELSQIRTFLKYRHKIVHVSPMITSHAHPGDAERSTEMIFADKALAAKARIAFDNFVQALHAATLNFGYA